MSSQIQTSKPFDWSFDPETEDPTIHIKGRKIFFFIAVFTIILLFTAIFLCARWIFRNRTLLTPNATPSQTFPYIVSFPPEGLDAAEIKKLPIVLHQTTQTDSSNRAVEESECCICLSAFEDGEKVKMLPVCNHCFHCECVDSWLVNRSSCPLCRAELITTYSTFPRILIEEPPIIYNHPL